MQPVIGNPVALSYGAKIDRIDDYASADGLFTVTRHYRSRPRNVRTLKSTREIAGFGKHWHGLVPGRLTVVGVRSELIEFMSPSGNLSYSTATDNFNINVWTYGEQRNNRRHISMVTTPTVDRVTFFQNQPAVLGGPGEVRMDMANGDYILFRRTGSFDAGMALATLCRSSTAWSNGYKRYFDYPDSGEYPNRIRDSLGREMQLSWVAAGVLLRNPTPEEPNPPLLDGPDMRVISEILLPDQTRLRYDYGTAKSGNGPGRKDRLERVNRLSSTGTVLWGRSYLYEDTRFAHSLTGMLDQNGARLSTYSYDDGNLAASTELAGGVNRYTIVNSASPPGGDFTYAYRLVTNPLGRREKYHFYQPNSTFETSPQLLGLIRGRCQRQRPC